MAAVFGWFGTMTGIRRTSSSDTLNVLVLAYADMNPAGENGIQKVEFTTVVNGGAPSVTNVTTRTLARPNHSVTQCPMPYGLGMQGEEVHCFTLTLDCNALAQGTIEVTAKVYTNAGTTLNVADPTSSVILYNDKGGADSRPNTTTAYWSWTTGSDSNNGLTPSTPKKNFGAILEAFGPDVGGLQIIVLPGLNEIGGGAGGINFYTSGHWWVDVISVPGAQITRNNANFYISPCIASAPGTEFRVRFWSDSQQWFGNGAGFFVSSGRRVHAWLDGGYSGEITYDPAKPWSVRVANLGSSAGPIGPDGDTGNFYAYATNHTRIGTTLGFHNFKYVQDCVVTDYQGIAFGPSSYVGRDMICNALVKRHRYGTNEVLGYIDSFLFGVATYSTPSPGVTRITATGTIRQAVFGIPNTGEVCTLQGQLTELVGLTNWAILFTGWNANLDGPLLVTATGSDWFEVANPSATGSGPAPSGCRIQTNTAPTLANPAGGRYVDIIHTDVMQSQPVTGSLWYGIRTEDVKSSRGIVDEFSGFTSKVCMVNCSSASAEGNDDRSNNYVDSLFIHNNFFFLQIAGTYSSSCNFIDNVMRSQNNFPSGVYARNNHFIVGITAGTNATSGPWYSQSDITESPYSLEPTSGNLGTGSDLVPGPTTWRWSGASADSRGVYNIAGTGGGGPSSVSVESADFSGSMSITAPVGSVVGAAAISITNWTDPTLTFSAPTAAITAFAAPEVEVPTVVANLRPSGGTSSTKTPNSESLRRARLAKRLYNSHRRPEEDEGYVGRRPLRPKDRPR